MVYQKEDWKETLTEMIEREVFLATGDKNQEHFSGTCLMNEIVDYVEQLLKERK